MKFGKRFDKAKDLVALALEKNPDARGNDKELIRTVWEIQGFRIPKDMLPFFYKVMSPATIMRARRYFQGIGQFLPEAPKVAQRTLDNIEQRQYFRNEKTKI